MPHPKHPSPANWLANLSLRRIVSCNQFIPEVDGFRFLAILIVIIAHTYLQCAPHPGPALSATSSPVP